jgi:hypothetical protein
VARYSAASLPAGRETGESSRVGENDASGAPAGVFGLGQSTQTRVEQRQLEAEIRQLSKRDMAVRNHERIHASVAGAHGGAPQFQFQRGPDGVLYAVAGHVAIDLSPVPGNPQATLVKARTVQRAALAPADPSAADRAVAARAGAIAADATTQISQQARAAKDDDQLSQALSAQALSAQGLSAHALSAQALSPQTVKPVVAGYQDDGKAQPGMP